MDISTGYCNDHDMVWIRAGDETGIETYIHMTAGDAAVLAEGLTKSIEQVKGHDATGAN